MPISCQTSASGPTHNELRLLPRLRAAKGGVELNPSWVVYLEIQRVFGELLKEGETAALSARPGMVVVAPAPEGRHRSDRELCDAITELPEIALAG